MPHGDNDPDEHSHSHPHSHPHAHPHAHPHSHAHNPSHETTPSESLGHGAGVGKVLHLDCFSGVAGDMLVAALLDLGVPREPVERALEALPLGGYSLGTRARTQSGIVGLSFVVELTESQPQRGYKEIREMLMGSELLEGVRSRALATFGVLAEAEGRCHRISPEEVHFHEVGAVDAIVDIVSVCALLEWLGARVTSSPLPMGRGFVRCAHGLLPLPAPAVVEVLRGVPTYDAGIEAELVTPTGAALVRAQATGFTPWPSMRPLATGFGAGTRSLGERPNLLRVVLGTPGSTVRQSSLGSHVLLEANLDDATAELSAHVTERLMREGALDAWTSPIGMKKGRPGVMLSALAPNAERERIGRVMLSESGSLGLRFRPVDRMERPRRVIEVDTRYGRVGVKVADGDGLAETLHPEFDVCKELAARAEVPVRWVVGEALAEVRAKLPRTPRS